MSFKSPYRMLQGWRRPREAAMGFLPQAYFERVLATGPIAYWIQGEAAGPVAIDQIDSPAQDGTYVGVTLGQPGIGDENTSPFFDSLNDYNTVGTVALAAAFNAAEGSMMIWGRVFNIGVWTDGANRMGIQLGVAAANRVFLEKSNANNTLRWAYRAGGVLKTVALGAQTTLDWFNMIITWSGPLLLNEMRAYYNGLPTGVPQVALGAWVGNIIARYSNIGCWDNTGPLQVWHGWSAHGVVWDRVLTPAEALLVGVL